MESLKTTLVYDGTAVLETQFGLTVELLGLLPNDLQTEVLRDMYWHMQCVSSLSRSVLEDGVDRCFRALEKVWGESN